MHDGKIRFFLGMGGNFLAATPDTEYTAKALQKCRVTAHVSTKLNRSHLITGEIALILPCLGRSEIDRQETGEQFVTVEDSMGVINPSRGHARAGERASAERARDRRPVSPKRPWAARTTVDWKGLVGELRPHPRSHRARHSAASKTSTSGFAQDIFYLPNDARDKREVQQRHRQSQVHRLRD